MRIEKFYDRKLGWDFSVGPTHGFKSWFAIWWTRRCDCGAAIGNKEIRFSLNRRAEG
ncbi:hypothetical protein [Mesorhizobium sp.]|uniref:hypothetical protein n=1 Tax=Mesorhizobium sp. TaxID=1871066 RepID=UPI00258107DE|nr:hypothetical protein [Mesorhizobium sp.]